MSTHEELFLQVNSLIQTSQNAKIQKALRNESCRYFRKTMQKTDSLRKRKELLTYARELGRIQLIPAEYSEDIEL
jgi:hypothetical protein